MKGANLRRSSTRAGAQALGEERETWTWSSEKRNGSWVRWGSRHASTVCTGPTTTTLLRIIMMRAHEIACRWSLNSVQRLGKVFDEVLLVFDADGQTNQTGRHFERRALHGQVRHGCGQLDQGLDAAQALGQRKQFGLLDDRARGLDATFDLGGDHAAKVT